LYLAVSILSSDKNIWENTENILKFGYVDKSTKLLQVTIQKIEAAKHKFAILYICKTEIAYLGLASSWLKYLHAYYKHI